ncbi:serine protease [Bacteriovorax sp. Seq25_V]|uniref:trypsin-like serine peptidase n=1 Tax=Bacteriovorax sp. Seq25_V TaxID=1201288 RepID=UPI00038A4A6E|nr:trypsin-like serine protease [Bacteriovorax sp. Seq25_V]EQC47153.1 trypsin [Bacteriovorax sp. Seq25_V]
MKSTLIAMLIATSPLANDKTICGPSDNREPSYDTRIARASEMKGVAGCTVTMVGRSCAISAGHCVDALEKLSFNVPRSINGQPQASSAEDTYYRTKDFLRYENSGPGRDWAVIRVLPNKITGNYPGDVQGFYKVDLKDKPSRGESISITGYGLDGADMTNNLAQQTHKGEILKTRTWGAKSLLEHNVDTMGGNSGSSIISVATGKIIGIHTHGGCTEKGGENKGTLIAKSKTFKSVIEDCLAWEKSLE